MDIANSKLCIELRQLKTRAEYLMDGFDSAFLDSIVAWVANGKPLSPKQAKAVQNIVLCVEQQGFRKYAEDNPSEVYKYEDRQCIVREVYHNDDTVNVYFLDDYSEMHIPLSYIK